MRLRRAAIRRAEAGYNLVILTVAVTVMTILVTAALPLWSQQIRRDKEEELRFRGLQYAEAIRVFQARFGRLPVRLDELIEVRPRSIRRLWKDPMTESGEWGLLFAGVAPGAGRVGQPGQPPGTLPLEAPGFDGRGDAGSRTVTIGPIHGVFSLADEESIATFFGQTNYRKWMFTVSLVQGAGVRGVAPGQGIGPGGQRPGTAAPGVPAILPMQWIGRPFRPFLEQQIPGRGPGLQPPVGAGGQLQPGFGQPGGPTPTKPGAPAFEEQQ